MPQTEQTVAAVCLAESDLSSNTMTARIHILTPDSMGASACEDTAVTAAEILQKMGGRCSVGDCKADGRLGLFITEVKVSFYIWGLSVQLNGEYLRNVVSFKSWRAVDEIITELSDTVWYFQLEEFFPLDTSEPEEPEDGFSISVEDRESFSGCTWTSLKRVTEPGGLRKIREGKASSWQFG